MEGNFHLNEKGFWRFLNALFLSCIGLLGGGGFFGIAAIKPVHMLALAAALAFFFILNYAKLRGRILCVLAGIICLLGAGAVMGIRNYANFIHSYFSWLFGHFPWQEEWITGYEALQVIFLAGICYLLQMLMEKSFWVKIAAIILLSFSLLFCLFTERELSHVEVAFILCYIAVIFVEWTQVNWKKEKAGGIHSYMLWLMPLLILYFLLMVLMPVPSTPYGWKFVRNIYEQLRESFLEISQHIARGGMEDYDLSLSGFTESGELEGNLGQDDREIMSIESSAPLITNMYLTGKVYDTFDGRQWLQNSEDTAKERYMDTAETLYAVRRYEERYQQDYLFRARVKINYRYFHTSFLFAPLKTWELDQDGEQMSFRELGGSLLFEEAKGYGTEYEAVFYQMNAGGVPFYQFLQGRQAPDEKLLEEILRDMRGVTGEDIRAEDLERHRQTVYDTYLKEVTLSERVRQALNDITAGAATDVERLQAVETALASLRYTRTPGELPETVSNDSEFLDYFLFESGQGYCNYFATAFVLLARAQGLPARYVQGFCVPMKDSKEATVYSYMAHAWPEVYLDGIGWIPFEPTPGFAGRRYTPWSIKGKGGSISGEDAVSLQWPQSDADRESRLLEDAMEEENVSIADSGTARLLRVAGMALLSVFLTGLLIWLLDYKITSYRYRKMSNAEKLNADIRKIMRILGVMGLKREAGETLEEFAGRCEEFLEKKDMMCFLESFEGYLYGNQEVTPENIEEVKEKQHELMDMLWERNKFDFFRARIYNLY